MSQEFAKRLLTWYARHQRALPWRRTRDPYRIWVSEIMLQQTQVETVKPYYKRWLRRFPNLKALAAAPQQDVLALWEGLGYYARARNFQRAAQTVMRDQAGHIPVTVEGLLKLPGIGRYTAGAIASLAFGVDAAVLDGNVKRVLARAFDYAEDVKSPQGEKDLWALAESLVPAGRAGDYNQALMDLGATICTPRNPVCLLCPLLGVCLAQQRGVHLERPVTKRRAAVPHHTLAAAVIRKRGRFLLLQRPEGELLGGLWMFPHTRLEGKVKPTAALRKALRADLGLAVRIGSQSQTLTHAYSHFRVTLLVFECDWSHGALTMATRQGVRVKWAHVSALPDYPMGKTDREIARHLQRARPHRRTPSR